MTDYTLTHGQHVTREDGMCLMEAVAYLAGEPHTDAPACACQVLTAYAVNINDAMGKGPDGDALRAQYLHDLAPMLVGSRSTSEVERARAYVLADHAARVFAPLAMESAGLDREAAKLRTMGAVIDQRSAKTAEDAAWAAAKVAWAAAWAATWSARDAEAAKAAEDAAKAAAKAAEDAARAAWVAAKAAPCNAAAWAAKTAPCNAAAWAAARAALIAALEVTA